MIKEYWRFTERIRATASPLLKCLKHIPRSELHGWKVTHGSNSCTPWLDKENRPSPCPESKLTSTLPGPWCLGRSQNWLKPSVTAYTIWRWTQEGRCVSKTSDVDKSKDSNVRVIFAQLMCTDVGSRWCTDYRAHLLRLFAAVQDIQRFLKGSPDYKKRPLYE